MMPDLRNCYTSLFLETDEFLRVIEHMDAQGFPSLIWQSKKSILSSLGIAEVDARLLHWMGYSSLKEEQVHRSRAEIFKVDASVMYLLYKPVWHADKKGTIEAGIFTNKPEKWQQLLQPLVSSFSKAVTAIVDGRKLRHQDRGWRKYAVNGAVESRVRWAKTFSFPEFDRNDLTTIGILTDSSTRNILKYLAQSGKLTAQDIKNKKQDELLPVLDQLFAAKLINAVPHTNVEQDTVFSMAKYGKLMMDGSHWMNIWLTDLLMRNNIPKENITWNLKKGPDEIDMAIQYKNDVWIVELKDGNFEAGHAHKFQHRMLEFKASRAIIISTGKIVKDARAVLSELNREHYNKEGKISHPLLIEGLETVEENLLKLMHNTTVKTIFKKCEELSEAVSFNLLPVFESLYGRQIEEWQGEFKKFKLQ